MFGIDVHGLSATHPGVLDARVFGYPRPRLADIPPGDYWVQALLTSLRGLSPEQRPHGRAAARSR